MSTIALLGSSVATLNSANNMEGATTVQITNVHSAEVTLTVAQVGSSTLRTDSFPGTIVIESGQTIILKKGATDTISGGSAGHLVATAVEVVG